MQRLPGQSGEMQEAAHHVVDGGDHNGSVRDQPARGSLAAQGLADERGDLVRDTAAGLARMRQNNRQAQGPAVDEAVAAVVREQVSRSNS